MMNAATVEVQQKSGCTLPQAHHTGALMGSLAQAIHIQTGFENFGVPYCMTIEPDALGSEVDYGSQRTEPRISREPFASVQALKEAEAGAIVRSARAEAVFAAVTALHRGYGDIPVIGSVSGPLSTAASLVEPMSFLKELRKFPAEAHRVLDYVTREIIAYAEALSESGADVICIADPTATGEILGPKLFEEFALPPINALVDSIHRLNVPVILHICGELRSVRHLIPRFHGDAFSVDAMVNLRALKAEIGVPVTMGNLSTYLLEAGDPERIIAATVRLLHSNIDIIAPACGLSTSTPLPNLLAFSGTVREGV
jgi:[methyl-Co(III) methanol-specific corrinoid protein]:coenzyme M methyltransferase